MRSNCKQVKEAIRAHIREYYDDNELLSQVRYIKRYGGVYPTNYHAVYHMVEGGCFLIYNKDVERFLLSLDINHRKGKEYDSSESFKLYCHLIARDADLILKHVNN